MEIIELNNVAIRFNLLLPAALVSGIFVYKVCIQKPIIR